MMFLWPGAVLRNILITIAVLTLFLLLRPGTPSAAGPSLFLSPVIAPPGTPVTITGTGFPANKSGTAWFDTNMNGIQDPDEPGVSASSNSSGTLSTAETVYVPGASPGYYPVRVKLSVDDDYLEAYGLFNISAPNMTIGLQSGPPGVSIIISGLNFAPGKSGWVWFDENKDYAKDEEEPAMWVTADSNGDFKATLMIPNAAPDSYPVLADLPDDGNIDGWTSFSVAALLILNPASGPPGTVISVTGKGLGSGIVWFDTNNNNIVDAHEPSTAVDEEYGRITASLVAPDAARGTYPVKLSIGGNVQCAQNFTVKGPLLTLNTDKGLPGQNLFVTGTLFPSNAAGRIWFDTNGNFTRDPGELDKKVATGSAGDFVASLHIPGVQSGIYAVRAEIPEGAPVKFSVPVSVMPAPTLTLNLNNGAPGAIVVVNGKDFKARTPGTVWFDENGNGIRDSKEKSVKATTDEYGNFRAVLSVPDTVKPGAYCIYADIPDWGKPEAWTDFFVNGVNPAYPGTLNISSVTPYDGALFVHRLPAIKLLFNNTIVKGPDYDSIALADEDGNAVNVNVTVSGKTVSIRPVGLLKGEKTYVFLVPALALLDTRGSGMAEDFIITFKTRL